VAGNGGDVINGTGQPGEIPSNFANGVSAEGDSHINVEGAVTVNGGRGGNVNTGTALSLLCSWIDVRNLADRLAPFVGRQTVTTRTAEEVPQLLRSRFMTNRRSLPAACAWSWAVRVILPRVNL
jgi:hypothetical protein